jgi:hypothetical protein
MKTRALLLVPAALLLVPAALFAGQVRYARLGEFEGQVEVQLGVADSWMPAERNLPLTEAAWVRTGPASRVEIELEDGSVLRLAADSQGELSDYTQLSTGQRVTTVSLDHGLAYFTGQPRERDALTLGVPGAQVIYFRKARVRLEAADTWSRISVLEGVAKFSCPAAEIDITQGTTTRVEPANPARFFLDREILAMESDHWSGDRDKAIATNTSRSHVVERYGLTDLDGAGEWISTDEYGTVWKPKIADDWAPFQKGRWRWYDTLGYTWVSDDAWGWLPYHYGRWARTSGLGWIWVPTVSQVFKPGEVFWMRGSKLVGWGPLAPGEQWTATVQPDQFINANTTYASFAADARVIDPAGFTARPKEPLTATTFAVALPSPPFPPSRLDATRPVLRAGSTRVLPVMRGVTYQDPTDELPSPPQQQPRTVVIPAPPQPVLVITQPAPDPEQVAVPVPVPYPVIAGLITPPPRQANQKGTAPKTTATAKAATPTTPPPSTPAVPHQLHKKLRDRGEGEIYNRVLDEPNDPAKQLVDLDTWLRHYRSSDFDDERSVLYMKAYAATGHPDKVVEIGGRLMERNLSLLFTEPAQIMSVLYLTTAGAQQLQHPTHEQRTAFMNASMGLINYLPTFFESVHRPPNVSEDDWRNVRQYMETTARKVIATNRH